MRKIFILSLVGLVLITSLLIWLTKEQKVAQIAPAQAADEAETNIGGSFTLTNQNGNSVSDKDLRGRVVLVFFGFTHCPDLCPVMVNTLSKTMELLGDKADQVAALFITVDPERDTPAVLKDFLKPFDRHIIGLTGPPEQIRAVASEYKTYYSKEENPADKDYGVDHSGILYVMGKDGKFIRPFPYDASAQEIADEVKSLL